VQTLNVTGLPSRVLPLEWPPGISPLNISNFETQARRLRYQALGRACRDDRRSLLLTAHHCEDVAETTLMRLATGHTYAGLAGISKLAPIPECYGIHGVCKSSCSESETSRTDGLRQSMVFESGGIQIMRPLLTFQKRQLIATCQARSVDWEEDRTNQDITQTPRNAVRSLLLGDQLPQALQLPSLLRLTSRSKRKRRTIEANASAMLDDCEMLLMEARSGVLIVRMPKYSQPNRYNQCHNEFDRQRKAANLCRLLVNVVGPYENVSLEQLQFAVGNVFPRFEDSPNFESKQKMVQTSFTAGGVHFQRVAHSLSDKQSKEILSRHLDRDCIWCLSRQAYASPLEILMVFPEAEHYPTSESTAWRLWDGRYWIRAWNRTTSPMVIRPLRQADLAFLRRTLSRDAWTALHNLLAEVAPDKIRYTLPVIADADYWNHAPGKVIVLPTLGPKGCVNVTIKDGRPILKWEVRYKAIGRLDRTISNPDVINTWLE